MFLEYDRKELYEKVWAQPLTKVAEEYGISAVARGKTCRRLQVPVPGGGYWAKKAYGHPVETKALSTVHEPPRILRLDRSAPTTPTPGPPPKPEFPVEEEDRIELARIDLLLSGGAFALKKQRNHARLCSIHQSSQLGTSSEGGFVSKSIVQTPWNEVCLDIAVSKRSLSRALRIMAAMVAILESNAIKVRLTTGDRTRGDRPLETSATILGEKVQFGITIRRRLRLSRQYRKPSLQ